MLKLAWSETYNHPVPPGHRFPMAKYDALPQSLIEKGIVSNKAFFTPEPATQALLRSVHSEEYIHRLEQNLLTDNEWRRSGFRFSPELIEREKIIAQGTYDCARWALKYGFSYNIAGGTHHAFANRAEGFCLFNDMAIALQQLIHQHQIKRALVIDLDVHQGNGTAAIFRDNPLVFTFSMHGKNNYPFIKEQSDLDIELNDGTGDIEYLSLLTNALAQIKKIFHPDLIAYNAGADVIEGDKMGRLSLTMHACRLRDTFVFDFAKSLQIPVVASSGGGYSENLDKIVNIHVQTIEQAKKIFF